MRNARSRTGFGLAGGDRRRGALLAAVPVVALLAFAIGSASGSTAQADGVTRTKYGPLAPSDVDFLRKVRLAGLWEGPSGQQAQMRSQNQAIRDAGIHMVAGHAELDAKVLAIANELDVELPVEPNADQKGWMAEMAAAKTPRQYDQIFVDRLRPAHGKVYGLVSQIRAGTRNSLIRSFATRTMEIVLDHITMLEATGLVNWSLLPLPPPPIPGGDPAANMIQTEHGPMTEADVDFLTKVRLAGLWEGPTGEQAQERSQNEAVREAGLHMIEGHAELDTTVLEVSAELGVQLPDEPNTDQKAWMAEMTNASTPLQYDQVFVNRLRAAHGKVYGLVSQIRAGTRNDLVRTFATRTMEVVLDHITMLERTNMVNFAALPAPPAPAPTAPVKSNSVNPFLVIAILAVAGAMTYAAKGRFYRL